MIALDDIGLTKEELQDRVIETICDRLLEESSIDEWESESRVPSGFRNRLESRIQEQVIARLDAMCAQHLNGSALGKIEEMVIQLTNSYGEKIGKPMTLIEFATKRCEDFMMESVDHTGKTKGQSDSYGWKATDSRLAWLIDRHLKLKIEEGVKAAMVDPVQSIGRALAETAKIKLKEIADKLRVEVATR